MHIRRLVKAGQASHTISLPKAWLEKNKLSKGSSVYVHEQSDTELLITPHIAEESVEQKIVTIQIDNKTLDTIQRELTAAYVNNANTIDLVGESISQHSKSIRQMLRDFVALEVAEQTANKISAKDLLNLQEISVDKSIKRMDIIVRTMLQDTLSTATGNDLSESVAVRDGDVNRLYFLLVRLLKNSPEFSQTNMLTQWMLVHHLEQLADAVKGVCVLLENKKNKPIAILLAQLEHDYRDVMKAMHEKNKQLADEISKRRIERQESATKLKLPEIGHGFSTISSLISDIARLVIDSDY